MCSEQDPLSHFKRLQNGVFYRKRLKPRVLPWQQHSSCHSVCFAKCISGVKFEDHLREQGWRRDGAGMVHGWRRDGAVVSALASHQCVLGLIPGPGVICGLSLLLALFLTPRGLFRVLRFPPLLKNQHFQIPIRSGIV